MDRTPRARIYTEEQQTEILSQIVDAMISAQDALQDADQDEWDQILRSSCRETREPLLDAGAGLAAVC